MKYTLIMSARAFIVLAIIALLMGAGLTGIIALNNDTALNELIPPQFQPQQLIDALTPRAFINEAQQLVEKQVFTPNPLRRRNGGAGNTLTVAGILTETNRHRAEFNLKPLTLNPALSNVADVKAADLFSQQYFEHVSPDGIGVADLVAQVDYDYLLVGENLALGNFESDADLVQAWMDSPGHRANILKAGFTEVGLVG